MMHENSQVLLQIAWETTAATDHECISPASKDIIAKVGKVWTRKTMAGMGQLLRVSVRIRGMYGQNCS